LFKLIEKKLVTTEKFIAALSLALLLGLSLFQIIVRNLFNFGFPEIEILNRYLLIICGLMGAVLASSHMRHIKIDALAPLLNEKTLRLLRYPVYLFVAIVCAALCYYSIIFCLDEWQFAPANERWTLPFTLIYPISFGLLCIHSLLVCADKNSKPVP